MRLGHGLLHTHMGLGHVLCTENAQGESIFFCFFVGKARVFSQNLDGNSQYKYQPSSFTIFHSELEQFKRKAILGGSGGVFYLLLVFLGYVFIFSNLSLVTMCN